MKVFHRVLCVIGISACTLLTGCDKPKTEEIKTLYGKVQGRVHDGVNEFLGIPYAAPPTGTNRWSYPHRHPHWFDVLQANKVPPHCFQSVFGVTRGQEDCLYLNIWSPNLKPEKPLPVIVWIHGGGFTVGHSYETTPGERLAKRGNVVVVSINYRLGALGFMAHPALSSEANGASGNYGMRDQIFALQWIQKNILPFGGDRFNITVVGESAGGMSVCNLLTSPYSQGGHFQKAIIESGPCFSSYPDLASMEKIGVEMQAKLGCNEDESAEKTVVCMRSKTPEQILAAMPPDPGMVFGDSVYWMPNIDGQVFYEQPWKSLQSGSFERVPVINGNNANEGSLMVMFGHEYQLRRLKAEQYPDRIRFLVRDDEKVKKVLARYPLENYSDPETALATVMTDQTFACQEKWTTDAIAKYAPTYSYYFSYPRAAFVLPELRKLGAFHSAEVQFLFATPMAWLQSQFHGDEATLSNEMIDYWSQFARTGNPNGEDAAHNQTHFSWPQYQPGNGAGNRLRLQLDAPLSIKPGSDNDEICAFWEGLR